MGVDASTLRKLADLELAPDQMAGVLGILADFVGAEEERERKAEERRAKDRERKRNSAGIPPEETGNSDEVSEDAEPQKKQKRNPPIPPLEKTKKTPSSARATRLADDWRPPPEWIAFALSEAFSQDEAYREADKFLDYWTAQPGAKGRKRNWFATWRNWIRRAGEGRRTAAKANGNGSRYEQFLRNGQVPETSVHTTGSEPGNNIERLEDRRTSRLA